MATDGIDSTRQPGLEDSERQALQERLLLTRECLANAARAAGRRPQDITLIGVSKFFPAELAMAAVELGLDDLGENRVQELLAKREALAAAGLHPAWHLIGTLQSNKVRQIVGKTCLIHSADSLPLLAEISRRSQAVNLVSEILLQVNTAGEATKHGFEPEQILDVAEQALLLPGIRLRGLMTMAPLTADADDTLPVFERTRELFARLADQLAVDADIAILSMGMSHDYEQAIRCGATHVRIGRAIFGSRV